MATGRVPTTANSPLTAKGDLFTYSTAPARLAVGNNGESLVADSAATTGLRYQATSAAGKNSVINGGFDVWQRGTSFTATVSSYGPDRWQVIRDAGAAGADLCARGLRRRGRPGANERRGDGGEACRAPRPLRQHA